MLSRLLERVGPRPAEPQGTGAIGTAASFLRVALTLGVRDRIKYAGVVRDEALACLKIDPHHPGCEHVLGVWNAEVMRLNGFSRMMAKNFLGVTYYWGGTSSFGFDCSGFTQMLVRMRGIIMPRDADLQAAWSGAVAVKREELRPGDLLFFDTTDSGAGSGSVHAATHVGISIGGDEFVHAPSHTGEVRVERLGSSYWAPRFIEARRLQ